MVARRVAEERPADAADYAAALRREAQLLRYRAHDRLLHAFLDEDVYAGRVRVERAGRNTSTQVSLLAE
jgi:hypothetical protein